MSGTEARAAWLRGQVLLALLVPALTAASGQPLTTVVAVGALALVCAAVPVLLPIPPSEHTGVATVRWRAWGRAQSEISSREEIKQPRRD